MLPPDRSVDIGWNLGLESISINGVDCTERERGSRIARGVGRIAGQTPVFVALASTDIFIQTFVGLFYTTTAHVITSRDVGECVELAWANPKQGDQVWYAKRVPQGNREHELTDHFNARFKAMSPVSAQDIADRITALRDQHPVPPRSQSSPRRRPGDEPFWYAVDPWVWDSVGRAVDAAAAQRLAQFNNDALALYDERLLRALGYVYASLTVAKAGEDLLGNPTPRESIIELAKDLEDEWAAFRMADTQHLEHALVMAILGRRETDPSLEGHPRLEHMLVAAGLLLRRLGRRSADYRERVAGVLKRNPITVSEDWFEDA